MVTTRPPKTIVKPTALGPVANTDTKLLIYGLFQKGRVLAQDDEEPEVDKPLAKTNRDISSNQSREWALTRTPLTSCNRPSRASLSNTQPTRSSIVQPTRS